MTKRIKSKAKAKKRVEVLPAGRHGVIGLDPGGETGMFAGVVTLGFSMKATAATIEKETLLIGQTKGSFHEQSYALADKCSSWIALLNMSHGIALPNIHVMMEDFVLRRRPGGEGSTGNLTSCWVAAGVHVLLIPPKGALENEQVEYAQASQAKSYATDERLKSWGLYQLTKGKRHARDASRHWALKVNKLIQ